MRRMNFVQISYLEKNSYLGETDFYKFTVSVDYASLIMSYMAGVRLQGLDASKLYQRRQDRLSGTMSLLNDGGERGAGIFG